MPFFSKPLSNLAADDLRELLTSAAVENIRLEFKRDIPGPDELIKKVSGFANAFGGYLIVGAEASSADGRIVGLPGVPAQPGYRQTVVQRCNEGIWPPPVVSVSDPLEVDSGVCYVIYVPPSLLGPHFLTKRRGAYIRTDEYSHRFETKLATFDEITQLAARRASIIRRRDEVHRRSEERFQHLVDAQYASHPHTSGGIGATLAMSVLPEFPTRPIIGIAELSALLYNSVINWRQVGYPMLGSVVTQHESMLALHAGGSFSLFEATTWGSLFYANEIESMTENDPQSRSAIHLHSFLGHVLAYLEHAKGVLAKLPELGPLLLRVKLVRVRNIPFVLYPFGNTPQFGPASPLDDTVEFDLETDATRLGTDRNGVALEALRLVFFALNWPDHATEAACQSALAGAAKYNFWQ